MFTLCSGVYTIELLTSSEIDHIHRAEKVELFDEKRETKRDQTQFPTNIFLLLRDKTNSFRLNKVACGVISEDTCNQLWPE